MTTEGPGRAAGSRERDDKFQVCQSMFVQFYIYDAFTLVVFFDFACQ